VPLWALQSVARKIEFRERSQADLGCPDRQRKIFRLTRRANHRYVSRILSHSEGRLAIVTDAGQGAVDVDAPLTNGTEADGEVVWS
jgi:hypothetical protein